MAEEIDFPGGIESQAIALSSDAAQAKPRLLLDALCIAALQGNMRGVVELILNEDGSRRAHSVGCNPQVQICRERPALECIELRILELLPPGGFRILCQER